MASATLKTETKTRITGLSSADLLMIGAMFIWGVNFVLVKAAVTEMRPLGFGGLRFALAAAIMLLLWRAAEGHVRIARGDWPKVVALGIIGNTAYQLFFIVGIRLTTASNSSLVIATSPIWVALFARIFTLDRLRRSSWLGIILSFAGLSLIVDAGSGSTHLGSQTLAGDLLSVGAAVSWALYTLFARPLLAKYSSLTFTTWSMAAGAPPILLAGIPELLETDLAAIPLRTWSILVFSATFALAIGYIIWNVGVHRLGQSRTANYVNMVPVVALAVGAVFLSEAVTAEKMVGAAVVLIGITLARRG